MKVASQEIPLLLLMSLPFRFWSCGSNGAPDLELSTGMLTIINSGVIPTHFPRPNCEPHQNLQVLHFIIYKIVAILSIARSILLLMISVCSLVEYIPRPSSIL